MRKKDKDDDDQLWLTKYVIANAYRMVKYGTYNYLSFFVVLDEMAQVILLSSKLYASCLPIYPLIHSSKENTNKILYS